MCMTEPTDLLPRPCRKCGDALQKTRGPAPEAEHLFSNRWIGSFECIGCGAEFRIEGGAPE